MNPHTLTEAVALAGRVGHVFIATADPSGQAHLAAARRMVLGPEKQLAVSDWLCPKTVVNLQLNRFLSLVAWDPATDYGFQLLGELQEMRDLEMMNGYSPELEKKARSPRSTGSWLFGSIRSWNSK